MTESVRPKVEGEWETKIQHWLRKINWEQERWEAWLYLVAEVFLLVATNRI